MTIDDMFSVENTLSTHEYKGVSYNLFKVEDEIGWSALIDGNKYGNYIISGGQWRKNGNDIDIYEVVHDNAKESIDLIL